MVNKAITVNDFKDFLLLIPEEESLSCSVIKSGRLITAGDEIYYAGPAGEAAAEAAEAFRKKLEAEGMPFTWHTEEGRGRYILPPFANTHCHIAMSLFRGSPADYNLKKWLFDWIFPQEARLDAEIVRAGSDLAFAELIRSGCGAVCDMYFYEDATIRSAAKAGVRVNISVDAKNRDADGNYIFDAAEAERFALKYRDHKMVRPSLMVHSPYLYQESIYPELGEAAMRLGLPVQVHVSETEQEVSDLRNRYGKTGTELLEAWGLLTPGSVLAHCVWLSDGDIEILKQKDVFLAHNPASNCKLGSGICDTERLARAGLRLTLGTDGAGSNDSLNLFSDLRLAAFLPKAAARSATAAPPGAWLYRATLGGYQAAGFGSRGLLKAGAPADLVIYEPNCLGSAPAGEHTDPVSLLVYAGTPEGVRSMMIGGRFVLRDGELIGLDEEKIIAEAGRAARKLQG